MADGFKRYVSDGGTLDRLVSGLTLEERHNLLDKLKGQANLSPEPLYEAGETGNESGPQENFDEQYARLPWYYRLYFFILSFFKGRPPNKIFEESRVGKLGREIDVIAPGLYDYQRNYLLAEFCRLLTDLKEGARFFFTALDASVNRDKGGFYAFLGSLEMGEVHKRLLAETDPVAIAEKFPEASEADLRQTAFKAMEDAFAGITQNQRDTMYHNTRSLYCLKELSSFLFDRVIMAFGFGTSGQTCSASVVKDLLTTLNNILFSLKEPPPLTLLESLFIFLVQEKAAEVDFDAGREMRRLLTKAENALVTIRNFNKQVPLTCILRCAGRDLGLSPQQIGGGEDWFLVYREYWKRQIEGKFAEYMRGRKHRDLLNSFRYFLKGTNLKILDNVVSDSNPDGLPIPEAFSLSFLLTFYSAVFLNDINKILRPILIDGEFFKRENRTEFTEAYNDLIKLEDDIRKFERNISPSGDYGKRYTLARQDISSLPVKRRKIQIVLEDASRDAGGIIERGRGAMRTMINILNGIMGKDSGGKYDTLGNLARLSGKTPVFTDGMADSVQKFQQTLQLLDDIEAMESVR
jgi:hypothetical protein